MIVLLRRQLRRTERAGAAIIAFAADAERWRSSAHFAVDKWKGQDPLRAA